MIKIQKNKGSLRVSGHANYAPYGQDIVCAMVSVLLLSFVGSCGDDVRADLAPGNSFVEITNDSDDVQAKLNMLMFGLRDVATSYPDYIDLTEHSSH